MSLIATLNVGSSSVKIAAFDAAADAPALVRGEVDGFGAAARFTGATGAGPVRVLPMDRPPADHAQAVRLACDWLAREMDGREIVAVGHRVVHGGATFAAPVRVDDGLFADLATLAPLAPLHQPHNLSGIAAARAVFHQVPQIACFDTAFHRTHPLVADVFALPKAFYKAGVRRYGFHGLSYEYVAGALRDIDPAAADGRLVIAHLGNGASMCALRGGRSMASSMGFSALDGLPMGTRCGAIDPGVVLYLLQEKGMTPAAASDLLYKQSGLLGLSGISHDMRRLEASDSPDAKLAIDYFVYRVCRELGAMAAILEGVETFVFTGGIGENATSIRARICAGMQWLGLTFDPQANHAGAQRLSSAQSGLRVYVVPTDEERMIARHARRLLAGRAC